MKKGKLIVLVAVMLTGLVLSACTTRSFGMERGSGVVVTKEYSVSGFDKIQVDGAGQLNITQGSEEGLTIEAEDNILAHIKVEVKNKTLVIGYDRFDWDKSIYPTKPIVFTVTVKDFEKLQVNGAVDLNMKALESEGFQLIVNGAGDFKITDLAVDDLDVRIAGGASINFGGVTESQVIKIDGAGNYAAENLESQKVNVTISGVGNVTVWATETLDVEINGAGSVNYYGSPKLTKSIEGLGTVSALGSK